MTRVGHEQSFSSAKFAIGCVGQAEHTHHGSYLFQQVRFEIGSFLHFGDCISTVPEQAKDKDEEAYETNKHMVGEGNVVVALLSCEIFVGCSQDAISEMEIDILPHQLTSYF